ncbi:hypothetical protein QH494_10065 [Sphingomonas sp. AR_OL41]|uniref:hypothetical protein n=1 Tax=Sphingomonas sp. AR_OL41 TaxID=3042729 RepID=UPI00248132A1|nr:hypothetical protein [Sphingomonas sp. AR_OL41]MDH7972527.1 hypothetical protein [Sphingomonas sp. AR_OL41]
MSVLEPGAGLVFMRVGTHAGETLEAIVARKLKEIEDIGHAFWGYGGLNCHPRSVVQPYAEEIAASGGVVRLCMEEVAPDKETYWAESEAAREWSIDGLNFRPLPPGIRVTGSRYAFLITALRSECFELPLTRARVAAGPSRGRPGAQYVDPVGGRVDKAVLRVEDGEIETAKRGVEALPISYVADLHRPYAVFLR